MTVSSFRKGGTQYSSLKSKIIDLSFSLSVPYIIPSKRDNKQLQAAKVSFHMLPIELVIIIISSKKNISPTL